MWATSFKVRDVQQQQGGGGNSDNGPPKQKPLGGNPLLIPGGNAGGLPTKTQKQKQNQKQQQPDPSPDPSPDPFSAADAYEAFKQAVHGMVAAQSDLEKWYGEEIAKLDFKDSDVRIDELEAKHASQEVLAELNNPLLSNCASGGGGGAKRESDAEKKFTVAKADLMETKQALSSKMKQGFDKANAAQQLEVCERKAKHDAEVIELAGLKGARETNSAAIKVLENDRESDMNEKISWCGVSNVTYSTLADGLPSKEAWGTIAATWTDADTCTWAPAGGWEAF